jgi:hypothetical protein
LGHYGIALPVDELVYRDRKEVLDVLDVPNCQWHDGMMGSLILRLDEQ